jgi:hypothetical protein
MTQPEWYSDHDEDSCASSSEDDSGDLLLPSQEDWEDWNSEELLNEWMSIVEYHEDWYLPLPGTFNGFCDSQFFSLGYK